MDSFLLVVICSRNSKDETPSSFRSGKRIFSREVPAIQHPVRNLEGEEPGVTDKEDHRVSADEHSFPENGRRVKRVRRIAKKSIQLIAGYYSFF